jgi:hypothetical protein
MLTVVASAALMRSLTLSLVKPNWVQDHRARQRIDDVFGRHRIAGMELHVRPQLEGVGLAVRGNAPALGQAAVELADVGQVEADQALVDVGHRLTAGELERLPGIHRDDVVDLLGHDDRVLGRLCRQGPCETQRRHGHAGEQRRATADRNATSHNRSPHFQAPSRAQRPRPDDRIIDARRGNSQPTVDPTCPIRRYGSRSPSARCTSPGHAATCPGRNRTA